jgi:hypothetical protein
MTRGQRIGLLALALAVAVVAVVITASGDDDDKPSQTVTTARTEPKRAPPAVEHIRVRNGAAVGGIRKIGVEKGDVLRLRVTSDAEHEVHVHGYDIFRTAAPGRPARFRFEADIEGVFEIELEGTHEQIARLAVRPS